MRNNTINITTCSTLSENALFGSNWIVGKNLLDYYTLDRAKVLRCGQRPQRSALDPYRLIVYK